MSLCNEDRSVLSETPIMDKVKYMNITIKYNAIFVSVGQLTLFDFDVKG